MDGKVPTCVIHSPTTSGSSTHDDLRELMTRDSISEGPIGDIVPSSLSNTKTRTSRVRVMHQDSSQDSLKTGSQLRRTKLYHLFYLLALGVYTVVGALIFQDNREQNLDAIRNLCSRGPECFDLMKEFVNEVENCYRKYNRTVTHSMSDFTNALVYAFSVYTTIGYGNMAADTTRCRLATMVYGAFGIPLFFAFVMEEGNLCRHLFISFYKRVRKAPRYCNRCHRDPEKEPSISLMKDDSPLPSIQNGNPRNCLTIPVSPNPSSCNSHHSPSPTTPQSELDVPIMASIELQRKTSAGSIFGSKAFLSERRRVFLAGVIVFALYILFASLIFSCTTEFDYFTSVYFLFNSVALIGFGDVFPENPTTILIYAVFMILGVVLFSMCYFILQEEIREKAHEASHRARMSISKYSHSLVAHARSPWSRRNSPLYENQVDASQESAFERLKKRRQSAPAVAVTAANGKITKFREI